MIGPAQTRAAHFWVVVWIVGIGALIWLIWEARVLLTVWREPRPPEDQA